MIPNVVTEHKIGEFTLRILAYRKLTKNEIAISKSMYLRQKRRKAFPKEGKVTLL
jgi:hypothetical protein